MFISTHKLIATVCDLTAQTVHTVRDRLVRVIDALRVGLLGLWRGHQSLMDDRPDYGPQLAALLAILVSLVDAPTWIRHLISSLFRVYLASARGPSPFPRLNWGIDPEGGAEEW